MKISISTLKERKIYNVLYIENPQVTRISRDQFCLSVSHWANSYFQDILSIFIDIHPDTYSIIIVLNVNTDHEAPQEELEIPLISVL